MSRLQTIIFFPESKSPVDIIPTMAGEIKD